MKLGEFGNTRSVIWVISIAIAIAVVTYEFAKPGVPKTYVLPNDDFNQTTMNAIWGDVHKWHVETSSQDHSVYILTGGLRMANPMIMYADSAGNFSFAPQPTHQPSYRFTEWAESPANWSYQQEPTGGVSIKMGGSPIGKRVPWVKHETSASLSYFEWDMASDTTWYYFQHENTYITIQVGDFGRRRKSRPPFPKGVMTHLRPIGNPIK